MFRKQPQPRTFDYRPRFYDPDKEQSRRFRPQNSADAENPLSGMQERISRHFRSYHQDGASAHQAGRQIRQSNLRLILILGGLLLATLWFLQTYLPRIVALVE